MTHALVVAGLLADEEKFVDDLRSCGCQIEHRHVGEEALALVRRSAFDLVLVSLGQSGDRGSELIRRLRAVPVQVPVLALAGAGQAEALPVGATDVIELPLGQPELWARLHTLLRHGHGASRGVLSAGAVSLDLATRAAAVDGTPLPLTAKEAAVLELLMLRRGLPWNKEVLLGHLDAGADPEADPRADPRIIDAFVCRLRSKLARAGAPDLIGTVWGRGDMVRGASSMRADEPEVLPHLGARSPNHHLRHLRSALVPEPGADTGTPGALAVLKTDSRQWRTAERSD